jgi:uncharacterized membrane protein HdeD (DUF308 family)
MQHHTVMSQGRDEYATSRARGIPKGKGITMPRWLMMPAGLATLALGIVGLFHHAGEDGLVTLTTTKAAVFIAVGVMWFWMSLTWSYPVRRSLSRLFGWLLVVLGLAAIAVDNESSFVNLPWESLLYVVLGLAYLAAGYYPRAFDYRD